MSGAESQAGVENVPDLEVEERSKIEIPPDLESYTGENGYRDSDVLIESGGVFTDPPKTFQDFDELTGENLYLNSDRSAGLLENYFGQISRVELEDYVDFLLNGGEYSEGSSNFLEEASSLDSNLVLEVDSLENSEFRHINYSEGKISSHLARLLEEKASEYGGVDIKYIPREDNDRLLIRSSP